MAFGTRQQNDVGHSQTCGAIEEFSFSHIPTLTIPAIEFGATGIAKLYCQTFGESDEVRPVRQREVKTAREYDGIIRSNIAQRSYGTIFHCAFMLSRGLMV
jgi:hypothetical protein